MVERANQSDVQENGVTMEGGFTKEPLWLLNVLRGISALLIVLYHYTTQYDLSHRARSTILLFSAVGMLCYIHVFSAKWVSYSICL